MDGAFSELGAGLAGWLHVAHLDGDNFPHVWLRKPSVPHIARESDLSLHAGGPRPRPQRNEAAIRHPVEVDAGLEDAVQVPLSRGLVDVDPLLVLLLLQKYEVLSAAKIAPPAVRRCEQAAK